MTMTMTMTEPSTELAAADILLVYERSLGLLHDARSGEGRAAALELLAACADRASEAAYGHVTADTPDNPLAWAMTATLLRQLAAAQRGCILLPAGEYIAVRDEWEDLAVAQTAREFGAAFAALRAELLEGEFGVDSPPGDEYRQADTCIPVGDPGLTALRRLSQAAAVITSCHW